MENQKGRSSDEEVSQWCFKPKGGSSDEKEKGGSSDDESEGWE